MPFHLGPPDDPGGAYWTGEPRPAAPGAKERPSLAGDDTLQAFPAEPGGVGLGRAGLSSTPARPPAAPARTTALEPLLLSVQVRLQAVHGELDQLRHLAAKIDTECRRIEFAAREAARDLDRQRVLPRELMTPMPAEPAPVAAVAPAPVVPAAVAVRAVASPAAAPGVTPRPRPLFVPLPSRTVRFRWPTLASLSWAHRGARTVVEYGVPAAAGLLLFLSVLPTGTDRTPVAAETPPPSAARASGRPVPVAAVPAPEPPATMAVAALKAPAIPLRPPPAERPAQLVKVTPPAAPTYRGTLTIQSEPAGADVYVNQRYVGQTPLAVPRLRAGSHVVWVQDDGYRKWTAGVHVPADRTTAVRVNLERLVGR